MCHSSCFKFLQKNIFEQEIKGKKIIEVGSFDVNGTTRPYIEKFHPKSYVGVDIVNGPGVDLICNAENLIQTFGQNKFDVLIATEVLEHVEDWKKVIWNLKKVIRSGGVIIITTRSRGFRYHAYPHDHWRYEIEDMRKIFSDFQIEKLQEDKEAPGVMIKAKKRNEPLKNQDLLKDYKLYSIITKKRINKISPLKIFLFRTRYQLAKTFTHLSKILPVAAKFFPQPIKIKLNKFIYRE